MWKKIALGLGVALLLAGGIYWFTYTKELHTPVSDAVNAIPGDAGIIIESKQAHQVWKKLSEISVFWEALTNTSTFSSINNKAKYIDSLIASDVKVYKLLENRSLFVSSHMSGVSKFDFLYVYSLPNLTQKEPINDFFKKINKGKDFVSREYAEVSIHSIYLNDAQTDSLSFAFVDGILMMSIKPNLVEASIRQLKSGVSLMTDKNFKKVITTAGKNVDANIYVNYKNFPSLLSHFTSVSMDREVNGFSDFADCSGWDVMIKPNSLILSGFTQANDSAIKFLNVLRRQEPAEIELTKIIPSKTALMVFFSISNIKLYHRDYKNYLSGTQQLRLQSYEHYAASLERKYGINIERSMLDWIDGEMALVVTEPGSIDYRNNSYAVLHADNIEMALSSLNELANLSTGKKNDLEEDVSENKSKQPTVLTSEEYRNHRIQYINIPQLVPQLLGWQFKKLYNTYYTSIDDYIVFANSSEALNYFIDSYENNKVLVNDKNYKLFSENISNESNLYIYSSIARSANIYASCMDDELIDDIEAQLETFYKFEAVGMQFTLNKTNNLFYSNAYLKYNPDFKQESGTLWESSIDTTISSKPQLLINHNNQTKEIFVQDDANKVYLISNTGKILWTKQLNDKIIGDVKQIDALKNKKLQLLFATRSAIYLCDRNGKDMKGFPVVLTAGVSNAVTVVDYEDKKDYRMFVADEDKKIHCFKTNGDEVAGFKFGKSEALIKTAIQYHKIDGKDHLIALDELGTIYVFNRHGERIVKLKDRTVADVHSFYIELGRDYMATSIVVADTLGVVYKTSFSGQKEKVKMNRFKTNTFFEYKDINNDNIPEYIFVSNNELYVYKRDESLLFSYEFKAKISKAPMVLSFPDGTAKIGVVCNETNELYLFNETGILFKGFPVSGSTSFCVGDINNDSTFMLITGSSDKRVYVYQLM
ncbi:MAG: DUF3352 domain-containing protein [Bacteroidia bacterium]